MKTYSFSIVTATTERPVGIRGARDQRHVVEEPCDVEIVVHGFAAEPARRRAGLGSCAGGTLLRTEGIRLLRDGISDFASAAHVLALHAYRVVPAFEKRVVVADPGLDGTAPEHRGQGVVDSELAPSERARGCSPQVLHLVAETLGLLRIESEKGDSDGIQRLLFELARQADAVSGEVMTLSPTLGLNTQLIEVVSQSVLEILIGRGTRGCGEMAYRRQIMLSALT